jgi:RNA polymerase sigma-70 factor, ECF subfamily
MRLMTYKDGAAPRNVTPARHIRRRHPVLNFMNAQRDRVSDAWRANRAYLVDLAFRMLGDVGAAEDVVQEAFFRLLQAPTGDINDERGWLIVVTSRLCLDHMKSASSRRERPQDMAEHGHRDRPSSAVDPADRVTLDDEVRLALLVVLERLTPAERVVFVLHDVFQLPYDAIAATVGSRAPACRQLAHRARRKINESRAGHGGVEPAEHRRVTRAFIEACSTGDLDALMGVLDRDVSGEVDARSGVVTHGADRVARNILGYWGRPDIVLVPQPVCGQPAVLAFANRRLAGLLALSIKDGRITKIHVLVGHSTLEPLRAELDGAR